MAESWTVKWRDVSEFLRQVPSNITVLFLGRLQSSLPLVPKENPRIERYPITVGHIHKRRIRLLWQITAYLNNVQGRNSSSPR